MPFLLKQLLSCFIDNHDILTLASLNFALCSDLLDSNFYCFSCDVSNAICRIQFFVKGDWFPLDHFVLFQDFEHEIRTTSRKLIHLDLSWNLWTISKNPWRIMSRCTCYTINTSCPIHASRYIHASILEGFEMI